MLLNYYSCISSIIPRSMEEGDDSEQEETDDDSGQEETDDTNLHGEGMA